MGCTGAPSNEALPYTPGNVPALVCARAPSGSWRDLHYHFHLHLISCCVIPSCLTHQGQDPYPHGSFHLVVYAMPLVWPTCHQKLHLIFVFIIIIIITNIILFHIARRFRHSHSCRADVRV